MKRINFKDALKRLPGTFLSGILCPQGGDCQEQDYGEKQDKQVFIPV